jgi:hypothetical protein
LTHRTIAWARHTKQDLIIVKFDFAKAYDKVVWDFLFLTMRKVGVIEELVEMVFFKKM